MSELTTKQKDSFDDSVFGVPELRKFPLNDREHVLKAIQFFHHCPLTYKKELANNINKKAKEYNISISKSSNIYEYLNEEEQYEIDLFEDIHLLEDSLLFTEAFGMNEQEAKGCVDTAINMWKKRKSFIKTYKDKQVLLTDIRNEKMMIDSLQRSGDYNGIILRAKNSANKMNTSINKRNNQTVQGSKNNGRVMGNPIFQRRNTAFGVGAATLVGATVAGGALGKASANKRNNGRLVTKAKVGAGAVAGAAVGNVAAMAAMGATAGHQERQKRIARDPNAPLQQYANKYANFISNFQGEILELQPNVGGQQNQQEGEGED